MAPVSADDHPSQEDEALRRAREADRRRNGGSQALHHATRPKAPAQVDAVFFGIVRGFTDSPAAAQEDACVICGYWRCRCGSLAFAPAPVGNSGQCRVCGGWFDDWPGGVCSACQAKSN